MYAVAVADVVAAAADAELLLRRQEPDNTVAIAEAVSVAEAAETY